MPRRPAVFLDRDGTLNVQVVRDGKPYPATHVGEFTLFEGVPEACRALRAAGYALVVVTNQPDVGRGTLSQQAVEEIHARLVQLVPEIERVEVCYDPGRGEASSRRKPEPGMVLDAARALDLDLGSSWIIGDRWRDVDCGKRASIRTIFIDFGYSEECKSRPDHTVKSFVEAADIILKSSRRSRGEA